MNDDVTPKKLWDQSVNYINKLKKISPQLVGSDLKILAYPALLIYWVTMLMATFLQLN